MEGGRDSEAFAYDVQSSTEEGEKQEMQIGITSNCVERTVDYTDSPFLVYPMD